ncbi:proprotein convertase subtilisin/kexin type 5-like [Mercenaria mercenaria]|uniref:proprotein convertase subtilisin/kexin type 5-like n=1 Tax=Mercenaria mercenaria TaxID=6596 RepID=UPI00234E9E2F|nr:proprotein convertase subtilisin/kexin type 5-like [Mercenaria mercenaria]
MNWKLFLQIKSIVCLTVFIRRISCNEHCSEYDICPQNKPFCSEAGCVFECPQSFYVNGTICVSTCGDWFVKDRLCLRQCPDKWHARETLKLVDGLVYMEKYCTSSCNSTEYLFENTCVRACPLSNIYINNRVCSSHCTNDNYLLSNFSINSITYHECVGQCPHFVDDIYCTDKCGDDKFVLNSTCVDKCSEKYPLISDKVCVSTCPVTTVYIENNVCFRNCTNEKPFYTNKTCTKTCPQDFYLTIRSGIVFCEQKCQTGEYTYKNTCLNSCADDGKRDFYLFYLNQTCVEECPSNYLFQKYEYYFVGSCVASCSKDEFIYNRTCVKYCPGDTFLINNKCVNKCPENFPYICLIGKGGKCNGDGPSPNALSQKICMSSCPKNTFIFENSCVAKCPISYLVSEQECVPECPKGNPLIQNRTISYNTWTRCFYCYSDWKTTIQTDQILECVSDCRKGMVILNSTCVYECPYNYRYIENGTCRINACTTKYMYNDSSNMICTDSCEDEFFIYNNTCVKVCPDNVFITNKTCHLDTCETKYMYNTSTVMICTEDCTKYGLSNNNVCVEQCPFYVVNDTCVQTCPKSHAFIANQTRKVQCGYEQKNCQKIISYNECKVRCPETLYIHKDLCLDICPTSHFVFNWTCVTICPPSHPFHQQVDDTLFMCG